MLDKFVVGEFIMLLRLFIFFFGYKEVTRYCEHIISIHCSIFEDTETSRTKVARYKLNNRIAVMVVKLVILVVSYNG